MRTAAGTDGDLDAVPARLAHLLQVKGFMGSFVVTPLNTQWCGVHADLYRTRPVCVHLSIFMVVTFKLQLKIWPHHKGLVHRFPQVIYVVTDCQVVLQSEWFKNDPIPYWEGQSQLIIGGTCGRLVQRVV